MIFMPKKALLIVIIWAAGVIVSQAQSYRTLVTFDGNNGATPVDTPFVQGFDGNLYGTTLGGGSSASGTIFKISPTGKLTTLYSFCSQTNCADGALPYGGLVLASDGNFYGTTSQGASNGNGTIFRFTPSGKLTVLHEFDGLDGSFAASPLIQASDGDLYGITENGGTSNAGTIFKITLGGAFTSLHSFGSGDGTYSTGPLYQANDGNFYGTTEIGGIGYGAMFKMTPQGVFTIFHSFDSTDGSAPASGLIQASDGYLYGTTYQGGSSQGCPNGCGTIFRISLSGNLTTLHNFDSTEGAEPIAALIQANDGNFYGTTYAGGTGGDWGTVIEMSPAGAVTTLHSFDGTDGAQPYGPVSEHTSGNLYGTATNGLGTAAEGTVFSVKTRLPPFVSFVRNLGSVGQSVDILGQGFLGATVVSFHGVAASFTVKSDTFITATVPNGALSGFVTVSTTTALLKSNVPFRIKH